MCMLSHCIILFVIPCSPLLFPYALILQVYTKRITNKLADVKSVLSDHAPFETDPLNSHSDIFLHAREEGGMSQKKSPMVVTGVNAFF